MFSSRSVSSSFSTAASPTSFDVVSIASARSTSPSSMRATAASRSLAAASLFASSASARGSRSSPNARLRIAAFSALHRDVDQRVLIAELDDAGERVVRGVFVVAARVSTSTAARRARLRSRAGCVRFRPRRSRRARRLRRSSRSRSGARRCRGRFEQFGRGWQRRRGQCLDGFGAYADVAVAVFGAKKSAIPIGGPAIYAEDRPGSRVLLGSRKYDGCFRSLRVHRCMPPLHQVQTPKPRRRRRCPG